MSADKGASVSTPYCAAAYRGMRAQMLPGAFSALLRRPSLLTWQFLASRPLRSALRAFSGTAEHRARQLRRLHRALGHGSWALQNPEAICRMVEASGQGSNSS